MSQSLERGYITQAYNNNESDGTCCLIALIHEGKVSVASIGDSTALLLSQGGQMIELTNEHTPNRYDEYIRVQQAGGRLLHLSSSLRVEGVLQVTRSIGDKDFKQYLSSVPEICSMNIKANDQVLILSSDGIFEKIPKEEIHLHISSLRARGLTLP